MHLTRVAVLVLMCATFCIGQPVIDNTNWPYGADQIGNYWNYYNTASVVAVNIFALNPGGQGIHWDFTTGPTNSSASSEIRSVAASPGPVPPNTTYTEYQAQAGNSQWVYEDETATGTFARGISQGGTVYNYNAPQYNIYRYPMTMGTTWTSTWTWGIDIFGDIITVTSSRINEVVGWGTVTTPFGGPSPCLVIRQIYDDYAEYFGTPVVNEEYRIYEWVVPGIGSVCTIQSNNHETNWNFTQATGFYRLHQTNLGGDLIAPQITGVTSLVDTPNPGPYTVTATITDTSGIDSAAIYYSIANGPWIAAGPTQINGSLYTFTIPPPGGTPVRNIRYYIWARDGAPNQNVARNPVNAPASFYSFNWINDNIPPAFSNVTVWPSPTNFNGPYPVNATITDDNGVLFASLHYRFGAGAWTELPADGNTGSVYHFTIPAITGTTIIRYYFEAVDNSGFFNTGFHPPAGQSGPIVFQAVFTVPAAPQAVGNLTIRPSGADAVLNWTAVTQDINNNPIVIDHYNIYAGSLANYSDMSLVGSSPTNSFTHAGGAGVALRFYEVRAVSP